MYISYKGFPLLFSCVDDRHKPFWCETHWVATFVTIFSLKLLGISPFIVALIKELSFDRVPSGGAGNKMLMLLEGKGAAYIQDRGVSRWGK